MKIFLSYRRDDTGDLTGRFFDHLSERYGARHVFRDVDSIPYGVDFRESISNEVSTCDVFVAVVGPDYLRISDAAGRPRLENPDDFVRIEAELASKYGIPILVVLANGAPPLQANELPAEISFLADSVSFELRPDPNFAEDARQIATRIHAVASEARKAEYDLRRERYMFSALFAIVGIVIGGSAGYAIILVESIPLLACAILALYPCCGALVGWRSKGLLGALGGVMAATLVGHSLVLFVFAISFAILYLIVSLTESNLAEFGQSNRAIVGVAYGFFGCSIGLLCGLWAQQLRTRFRILITLSAVLGGTLIGVLVILLIQVNAQRTRDGEPLSKELAVTLAIVSVFAFLFSTSGALIGATATGIFRRNSHG